MITDDIKMKLLAGDYINVSGVCDVYPLTLDEIKNVGAETYQHYLNLLCTESHDLKKKLDIEEDFTTLEFILVNAHHSEEFKSMALSAFELFFKKSVGYNTNGFFYFLDQEDIIDNDLYEQILRILRMQNCLDGLDEEHDNPANDKARQLLEKKKKLKQKVAQAKQNADEDAEPLTLFDLISILAGSSGNYNLINKKDSPMNVWNLTMFQFNDAFNRLKMFNDFSVNVQALLHGASDKEVKLKHFISKISRN